MSDTAAGSERDRVGSDAAQAFWTVHQGDARHVDSFLESASGATGRRGMPFLQATITSPPYATLVDYGSDKQIGFGQTYSDYLESCRVVFEGVHKWTLPTGSMWVVADSHLDKRRSSGSASRLVPLPFDLAAVAESVGWTLREVVIWRKDRTRPWSHHGKLRNGFEYVLLFVKSDRFVFNVDSLRQTGELKSWWVKYPERHNPWGMTPDNVWEIPIPVQGSWDNSAFRHACPFPAELVRRMLLLSSNAGDYVFDPFAGSGSVVRGAFEEGRKGLGLELNEEYVSLFRAAPLPAQREKVSSTSVSGMTQRLLELRVLKYPKELSKQILRAGYTTSDIRAIILNVDSMNYSPARSGYGAITCFVVVSDDLAQPDRVRLVDVLSDAIGRAPLSKFGLDVKSEVITIAEAGFKVHDERLAVYTRGRTWFAEMELESVHLEAWIRNVQALKVVPIVSPLKVRQSLEESL